MRTRGGRSLKGYQANHTIAALHSRNISICCAMSKNDITRNCAQPIPFNSVTYCAFISDFVAQLQNAVIVVDNVPFHKNV
ncbi:hypothetical protein ENBRE01_3400 [Enteropsectra breve]|nr:hypothetical protein ENBRE01_3400 [Enteropsectra breve]